MFKKKEENAVTHNERDSQRLLPYPLKTPSTQKQAKVQAGKAESYVSSIKEPCMKKCYKKNLKKLSTIKKFVLRSIIIVVSPYIQN